MQNSTKSIKLPENSKNPGLSSAKVVNSKSFGKGGWLTLARVKGGLIIFACLIGSVAILVGAMVRPGASANASDKNPKDPPWSLTPNLPGDPDYNNDKDWIDGGGDKDGSVEGGNGSEGGDESGGNSPRVPSGKGQSAHFAINPVPEIIVPGMTLRNILHIETEDAIVRWEVLGEPRAIQFAFFPFRIRTLSEGVVQIRLEVRRVGWSELDVRYISFTVANFYDGPIEWAPCEDCCETEDFDDDTIWVRPR